MAFFDARFEVGSITELEKKLARLPRPVENAVRKSNRLHARDLRDLIRRRLRAVKGSGSKYGPAHDTKRGALYYSIKSKASGRAAHVQAGGPSAPHFFVQEFGGGVYWISRKTGKGHVIPIGSRKNISSPNRSGNLRGAEGSFFWPTVNEEIDQIVSDITTDALRIVHEMLSA